MLLEFDGYSELWLKGCSRELKRELAWSRIHLVPLLLAEQDRDAYRRSTAALAREKEIMKDVPGWEVSYNRFASSRLTWDREGGEECVQYCEVYAEYDSCPLAESRKTCMLSELAFIR